MMNGAMRKSGSGSGTPNSGGDQNSRGRNTRGSNGASARASAPGPGRVAGGRAGRARRTESGSSRGGDPESKTQQTLTFRRTAIGAAHRVPLGPLASTNEIDPTRRQGHERDVADPPEPPLIGPAPQCNVPSVSKESTDDQKSSSSASASASTSGLRWGQESAGGYSTLRLPGPGPGPQLGGGACLTSGEVMGPTTGALTPCGILDRVRNRNKYVSRVGAAPASLGSNLKNRPVVREQIRGRVRAPSDGGVDTNIDDIVGWVKLSLPACGGLTIMEPIRR